MATPKNPVVWVVVADGEHARVVIPTAVEGQFGTSIAFDSTTAHMRSRDLGTDHPGRVHESTSASRSAVSPRHDPHELAKTKFVVEVARLLNEHSAQKEFDQLVLVAPSHALHDLRAGLNTTTAAKVVGSVAKDFVKMPDHELSPHLKTWWLAPASSPA
jgi:protein required for attachment to host cells